MELKPGGSNIPVTDSNKIEYVHLMADYRINKQIRSHCNAFRQGLNDVLQLEWLQMFNSVELQVLISGASVPIDLVDLRQNTKYSGMTLTFILNCPSYYLGLNTTILPCLQYYRTTLLSVLPFCLQYYHTTLHLILPILSHLQYYHTTLP